MAKVERPDLRELVGIAVNSSQLSTRSDGETPLTRIAAVGAASLAVQVSADLDDVPIAASLAVAYGAPMDPRDVLAGELSPMLWHIRYGGQFDLVPRAIELFSQWIAGKRIFEDFAGAEHQAVRHAFAARAVHEWLSDRCTYCAGSKKQERSKTGQWIKPRGSMQRNATFRPCVACSGSGRAAVSHPERIKAMKPALVLTREDYEGQRWMQRFNAAQAWLQQLLPNRLLKALTAELERRTRRG